MAMKVNKRLNLVRRINETQWVHSVPISSEEFTAHWRLISKTFSHILEDGPTIGPRIAHLALLDTGKSQKREEEAQQLLAEIERNTLILGPNSSGVWESIPFEQAVSKGILDGTDADEIRGAVTFFTVASHMVLRQDASDVYAGLSLWSAETTSLGPTEYSNFLQTSTPPASSGEKATS